MPIRISLLHLLLQFVLAAILHALLPLLLQGTVKSIFTQLLLKNVVFLLWVIAESLSVHSSSLLYLTRVLELLSEGEIV